MKTFIVFLSAGLFILLIRTLGRRMRGGTQQPKYTTRDQIASIVSKLQQTGVDGSFVVFIPDTNDEPPSVQYSIENGRLGFDWVLLGSTNIKDETPVTEFLEHAGYIVSKLEMNDVTYLRVEGKGVEEVCVKILRDFYRLASDTKLEVIIEGFDMPD